LTRPSEDNPLARRSSSGATALFDFFSVEDLAHERGHAVGDVFVGAVEHGGLLLRMVLFAGCCALHFE
jgi:hypothetical protein